MIIGYVFSHKNLKILNPPSILLLGGFCLVVGHKTTPQGQKRKEVLSTSLYVLSHNLNFF